MQTEKEQIQNQIQELQEKLKKLEEKEPDMSSKIIPKTALIEIDGAIDDFYDEWEDNGDNIGILPTQKDYDDWLFSTAMGFFDRHIYKLYNYLKLKENKKCATKPTPNTLMKVEILDHPGDDNYSWKLYTGPDGINEYDGLCSSLGECFEEIIKHEILNGKNYE